MLSPVECHLHRIILCTERNRNFGVIASTTVTDSIWAIHKRLLAFLQTGVGRFGTGGTGQRLDSGRLDIDATALLVAARVLGLLVFSALSYRVLRQRFEGVVA